MESRHEGPLASALWLPLFDALSDPMAVARLAAEAEEAGWHGVFVWDHLLWQAPVRRVADPWITLAAIAVATERVRLSPLVTPLPRRRPAKVAKETATLDRLSNGRLILGGSVVTVSGASCPRLGEQLDDGLRGQMLAESLRSSRLPGPASSYSTAGQHCMIDGVQFLPRPVQRPGVPVWCVGFAGNPKPLRRAAGYDGYSPSTCNIPTSSPMSSPRSPTCVSTRRRRATTSRSPCPSASTRCRTSRRAPPGGFQSSHPRTCRWTRCGACCAMAHWHHDGDRSRRRGFLRFELRRHHVHFRAVADVRPGGHVLDIGCGTELTTREAARAAEIGAVLGVDVSSPALAHARRLAWAEGLRNVTFEQGDAQSHHLPTARFDLCISRFGTMFFTDPVAAFTHIASAMRERARRVLLVWQEADRNEWFTAVRAALRVDRDRGVGSHRMSPFC